MAILAAKGRINFAAGSCQQSRSALYLSMRMAAGMDFAQLGDGNGGVDLRCVEPACPSNCWMKRMSAPFPRVRGAGMPEQMTRAGLAKRARRSSCGPSCPDSSDSSAGRSRKGKARARKRSPPKAAGTFQGNARSMREPGAQRNQPVLPSFLFERAPPCAPGRDRPRRDWSPPSGAFRCVECFQNRTVANAQRIGHVGTARIFSISSKDSDRGRERGRRGSSRSAAGLAGRRFSAQPRKERLHGPKWPRCVTMASGVSSPCGRPIASAGRPLERVVHLGGLSRPRGSAHERKSATPTPERNRPRRVRANLQPSEPAVNQAGESLRVAPVEAVGAASRPPCLSATGAWSGSLDARSELPPLPMLRPRYAYAAFVRRVSGRAFSSGFASGAPFSEEKEAFLSP